MTILISLMIRIRKIKKNNLNPLCLPLIPEIVQKLNVKNNKVLLKLILMLIKILEPNKPVKMIMIMNLKSRQTNNQLQVKNK